MFKAILAGLVPALFSGLLWAEAGSAHLHTFLDNLGTLQARFEQSVLDPSHSKAERFQGVFYLRRPGQFRWDYSEPYEQLIVADGDRIWLYDSELEQVSHQSQDTALQGTPAQLLSDASPVEDNFEVIDIGEGQGLIWVELIPRDKESQFVRILLAFMGEELQRMELADQFGQVTRFHFFEIKRNLPLPDELFEFKAPAGIDIFGE